MSTDIEAAARSYGACFETLTPDNLDELRALVVDGVRFKDPFNDVRGADRMIGVMQGMFAAATDVRFEVTERACSGDLCFLRWRMACRPNRFAGGQLWHIDGVSAVRFDEAGRVTEHIDYWDAAEQAYERLPVLGAILRRIRRALSHDASSP